MNANRLPPLKNISFIQFCSLSSQEWQRYGSVEITRPIDKNSNDDSSHTPYDMKLGTIDRKKKCMHSGCGNDVLDCSGHFGHIVLEEPVYNPEYITLVLKILRCVCPNCFKCRITSEIAESLGILKTTKDTRFKLIEIQCKKNEICPHCSSPLPRYKEEKDNIYIYLDNPLVDNNDGETKSEIISKKMSVKEVLGILMKISDETFEFLGFNNELSKNSIFTSEDVITDLNKIHVHSIRPENFIISVLPVIPTCCRPWVVSKEERKDDDLTEKYNTILKINEKLKKRPENSYLLETKPKRGRKKNVNLTQDERDKLIMELMSNVWTLINNKKKKMPLACGGRPLKSLKERMIGKEGHINSNVGGKRVDFSARDVIIGGGPLLHITEIGLSEWFCSTLTYPEMVNIYSKPYLQKLVREGKCRTIKIGDNVAEIKPTYELKLGDVVERPLRDGDYVIVNRQPSLRIESMQGAIVKKISGDAIRLPEAVTGAYNADFDGDEMNIHVPQSIGARVEVQHNMAVKYHIISSQNNCPIISPVQNALLVIYLLTNTWKIEDSCYQIPRSNKHIFRKSDKFEETMISSHIFCDIIVSMEISTERYLDFLSRAVKFYPKYIKKIRSKNSQKVDYKLASEIPGKLAISIIFPRNFCYKKETKINDNFPLVEIKYGIMKPDSGPLCKKSIARSRCSAIQYIWKNIGYQAAADFISELQFFTNKYMPCHGFSIGPGDCLTTKRDLIAQKIVECSMKCNDIIEMNISDEDKEVKINNQLSSAMSIAPIIAQTSMQFGERNSLVVMKKSGAKGGDINNGQIAVFVGQQNIDGKRNPETVCNGEKTLYHFKKGEKSPEAKGMIYSAYINGLTPAENFLHAQAGRKGLIDTAVKTGETGYTQKKLGKKIEDWKVEFDATVRNNNGEISQFLYGEDGLNAKYLIDCEKLELPFFVDVNSIVQMLNADYELENPKNRCVKRNLTSGEFKILSSYIVVGIPGVQTKITEVSNHNIRCILEFILSKSHNKIYENMIPVFCKKIRDIFETSKAPNGYPAGIVSCCSIGETITQLTLNTFHAVGQAEKDITLGVPRLKELLNATQNPSKVSIHVHIKNEFLDFQRERKKIIERMEDKSFSQELENIDIQSNKLTDDIGTTFVEVKLQKLLQDVKLLYLPNSEGQAPDSSPLNLITYEKYERKWWVEVYKDLFDVEESPENWVIELYFDIQKLYKYKITLEDICDRIHDEASEEGDDEPYVICVPSPNNIGVIEVYTVFEMAERYISKKKKDENFGKKLVNSDNLHFFIAKNVMIPFLKNVKISGISGINDSRSFVDPLTHEWYLELEYKSQLKDKKNKKESVLKEIFSRDDVDYTRTISNDIWSVYKVLGIEATRKLLLEELEKVVSFDGTYINRRQYTMVVDSMTRNGTIISVNRDGINKENSAVTKKGMFEKSVDVFTNASSFSLIDKMNCVSSAIMFGTNVKLGTGMVDIKCQDGLPVRK